MPGFLPDPVTVEVVWQGESLPCRIRITLPDGSGASGELDLAALLSQTRALQNDWAAGQTQAFGQALYNCLFPGNLSNQYAAALKASRERGVRLALRLDETQAGLHRIPWERLFYPLGNQWLPMCAAANIVFSRYLQTGQPWGLPLPAGALKVLVVISSPFRPDNPLYVNPQVERQAIADVFDPLSGQLEYEVLSGAVTAQQIADRLNQGPGFDILHYVGHGDWREDEQTGYLILTGTYPDGSQGPAGVEATELVRLLAASPRLPQLIFLGACESGQQSTHDAFAGVGPQLVRAGCPAVVCMQEKVENAVARQFAGRFYASLLDTGCVDLAVNRARSALLDHQYVQWAVPVLYMHLADGILFNPQQRFQPAQRQPYKFLAAYQREDRDLFKGRQNLAREVYRHMCDYPVTLVYGEAGVGQTSLLEAGVRPLLEAEHWLVVSLANYTDLPGEFRVQLRVEGRPLYLRVAGDAPLADVLRAVSSGNYPHIALFLDQFEQVCELPESDQQTILQALEDSLRVLGDRLKLALLIHKDSLLGLTPFRPLLDNRSGPWIEIPPLELEEAVEAMVGPLDALGWPVTLTPELAREQIAPDLGDLYGEQTNSEGQVWIDPGQLQITCTWLYQKALNRRPPLIDENLYLKEAGGADGILVRYMEEELETRFAGQADLARQVLVAMAAPDAEHWVLPEQLGVGSGGTNGETAGNGSILSLNQVLDRLVKAELLVRRLSDDRRYTYAFANQTVAEEAIRLGGKEIVQSYNAGDELERVWRLWLASLVHASPGSRLPDRALASRQQLLMLAEYGQHLDTKPVKILVLLRAAVLRDETPLPWLAWLRSKEKEVGLIRSLEMPETAARNLASGGSARELAGRLVGLGSPDLPKLPGRSGDYGELAWAAAGSPDSVDRRTAALALMALSSGRNEAVDRLEDALDDLPTGFSRFRRRSEVLGALADAGEIRDEIARRSWGDRLGVYLWRAYRRARHHRRWITWMALGSGIGAGLGLGLERLLVGWLAQSPLATIFFALFSYWGLVLAGITGLFMALSGPLLLENPWQSERHPSRRRTEILMGTLGFGLANTLVAVLNGISLSDAPLVIPLGFVAGLGVSTALSGQDLSWGKRKAVNWIFPAALGALSFALVQAVFLVFPGLGSGISVSLSGGFFQVEFDYITWPVWQAWIRRFADWSNLLALVEAGLAGMALVLGALVGRTLVTSWYERLKDYLDRSGE